MTDEDQDYWVIKAHSVKKYRILGKYLEACKQFHKKYNNFVYVDSHGGSGKVLNASTGKLEDGSPLIARKAIDMSFPCYVTEISPARCKILAESLKEYNEVRFQCEDCNIAVPQILSEIEDWKFVLCFVDPRGLIDELTGCHELSYETVDKIGLHKKSELLLNFPCFPLSRSIGYCLSTSGSEQAKRTMEQNVTKFFGTDVWKKVGLDRRKLLELYITERLSRYYLYIGAILIRQEGNNAPLYYLVYGTKNIVGARIMRDIMRKEWAGKQELLVPLDEAYPINKFIFE